MATKELKLNPKVLEAKAASARRFLAVAVIAQREGTTKVIQLNNGAPITQELRVKSG